MSPSNDRSNARPTVTILFLKLVAAFSIVFVSELIADAVLPGLFSAASILTMVFADSIVLFLVFVPSFWFLVYKPMRVSPLVNESQLKLKRSEERFRNLADNAPVGIFETDVEGNCTFVNRRWIEIAGVSSEQAMGKGWSTALHPEDAQKIENEWYQSVREIRPFRLEYRFRKPEGTDTWVLGSATALMGESGNVTGYMGIIIDINEKRQAEKCLVESEDRFRTVFEQSEDAIMLFASGTSAIIDVNTTAEKLYGCTKSELMGRFFNFFKTKSDCQEFIHSVCMLSFGETCHLDHIVNLRNDGSEIHLSVRAKMIRLQERDAIYCTMRDISNRLQMEEESRSIQTQLIHANKMESLGLLVAGIAHEINNPNNYIMANAQMLYRIWEDLHPLLREESEKRGDFALGGLRYSKLEGALPEMITAINEGSRRIKNIIADLKNYSRQGSIAMMPVDINRVVESSQILLKHHISKYTDNFLLELGEGIPLLRGNSQQLEQVIINLVMNAIQSLTDRKQRLSLKTSYAPETQSVLITVSDEGCGIPEGAIDKVMDPFFTTRLDSGGSGLGLPISRSIIMAHHGVIDISSRQGEGTTVKVSIPVAESKDTELPRRTL